MKHFMKTVCMWMTVCMLLLVCAGTAAAASTDTKGSAASCTAVLHTGKHAFVRYKSIPSSCVKKGKEVWKCKDCHKYDVKTFQKRAHDYRYHSDSLRGDTIELCFSCSFCRQRAVLKTFGLSGNGTYAGIFAIPEKAYFLPLYQGAAADWQAITDAKDSGCLIIDQKRWDMPIIADHVNQGFGVIKTAVIGETVAIYSGNEYICVSNEDGWNCIRYLETLNGVQTNDMQVDLLTYTCNRNGTVRIVGWKKR